MNCNGQRGGCGGNACSDRLLAAPVTRPPVCPPLSPPPLSTRTFRLSLASARASFFMPRNCCRSALSFILRSHDVL